MRKTLLLGLLACFLFTGNAFGADERPKEIYAHYMGCFPVGTKALPWHRRSAVYDHRSTEPVTAIGGRFTNWDLVPAEPDLAFKDSVRLDIRRAVRAGFDGFALDAYAGGQGAKDVLDMMFEICEEEKIPFKITICLDPSCIPKHKDDEGSDIRPHAYADAIASMLDKHGKSPNLARRDGKPLIFGYVSRGIFTGPGTRENLPKIAAAYKEVERLLGQDIFFHFCMNAFDSSTPANQRVPLEEAYTWAARNFPAVGMFFDGYYKDGEVADYGRVVKQCGAEWSQPLWFQYCNRGNNDTYGKPGFEKLRQMWSMAREIDATLLQFVTWNDYGEDTNVAPGYNTNYAVMGLNRIYIDWWKTGREPGTENSETENSGTEKAQSEDRIFVSFLKYNEDAVVFPFQVFNPRSGVLEVTTLLKSPAKVELPGRDGVYDAPAGLHVQRFPLQPGPVEVRVTRDGATAARLKAPEEITDKPFRWDVSMYAFSTDCEREWKQDFPDIPFTPYAEYADADGDGLPNWFEMYYFGKLNDFSTKTSVNPAAAPDADPDGDGVSNLEEYRRQTDPCFAEKPYAPGYVWNFEPIVAGNRFSNPDFDDKNQPVWYYLYKTGKRGEIAFDGDYRHTRTNSPNVSWAGKQVHISTYREPGLNHVMGMISQEKEADGKPVRTILKPNAEAAMILGWRSPLSGTITVTGTLRSHPDFGKVVFRLVHGEKTLHNQTLHNQTLAPDTPPVALSEKRTVKKGEFLYLIAECPAAGPANGRLLVDDFAVTLDSVVSEASRETERLRVTVMVSDDHYDADTLLPPLMEKLGKENNWDVRILHGHGKSDFPEIALLDDTDVFVVYIRRLALPKDQLARVKKYVASGRGLVALRTASHGFDSRAKNMPENAEDWPGFDKDVLGGHYHGHGRNDLGSIVKNVPEQAGSAILKDVEPADWKSRGSLYFTDPIAGDATLYQTASSPERAIMPLTWTRSHGKTRVAYTALGHQADFEERAFQILLRNLVHWAGENVKK